MITEIPVFLRNATEMDLSKFRRELQTLDLKEIIPYEGFYLNKDQEEKGFCFNVEGESKEEMISKLQKIMSAGLGSVEFASIKFCGTGANCCFSIIDKPIEEISAQIKVNPSKTFSSYLMRRNNNITYSISVLDPKNLQNLEYADCFQRITDWKKDVQSMMENLHASYIDFMQIGYCSL